MVIIGEMSVERTLVNAAEGSSRRGGEFYAVFSRDFKSSMTDYTPFLRAAQVMISVGWSS